MKKYWILNQASRIGIFAGVCLSSIGLVAIMKLKTNTHNRGENSYQCQMTSDLTLKESSDRTLTGDVKKNQPACFQFYATAQQNLLLNTNTKVTLLTPSKNFISLQGKSQSILPDTGTYSMVIYAEQDITAYQIALRLEGNSVETKQRMKLVEPSSYNLARGNDTLQLTYNVVTLPPFKENQNLQKIVNQVVNFVQSQGLPIERLSVSLVDLNSSECCNYAFYSDREPRFPASVVKLFWMVYLYGQYQARILPEGTIPRKQLSKMIQDSDNESASLIVDRITGAESGESLPQQELNQWMQKRYALNVFFEKAGYSVINISQKAFPTSYIKNDSPVGRDLQIRGGDETKPIRNYLTTYDVARLLFEINAGQSISKRYSQEMKALLRRNLRPEAWKNKPFNAIEGFLGESLPENASLTSKMGWNFNTRNDAAIIASPDGKHRYILVVFGDDPSFYKNKTILPEISRLVYQEMTK